MKKIALFIFLSIFLIGIVSADGLIRTQPVQQECVADGKTECQVNVWVDNADLLEATQSVEFRLMIPDELEPYITITRVEGNSGNPPENDFFAGKNMFWEYVTTELEILQSRMTTGGDGVLNNQGNVASYYFTIRKGRNIYGEKSLGLNDVVFYEDDGAATPQVPIIIENDPFTIVPHIKRSGIFSRLIPNSVRCIGFGC